MWTCTELEPDLLPYQTAVPRARSVLVLAPHPDDEVFGCGGTLVQMKAAGATVIEVILTSGDQAGDAAVREAESCAASATLGLSVPRYWRLPDRGVTASVHLVERLVDEVAANGVDLILAPSPWEIHPDHRAACQLASEAARRLGGAVRLGFYEVGVPLRPNCLCDITACVPLKRQAMDCFASQMLLQDYGEQVLALNRFRSYTLGHGVTHAEAFWFPAASHGPELMSRLDMDWVSPGNVAGGAPRLQAGGGVPVTVLVQPFDGAVDTLAFERLLDSISLQTYRQLEVWVLDAHAGTHSNWLGCSVRWVDAAMARTALPTGYALLARPGDWMLPDHVARLADALNRLPQTVAARTANSCRPATDNGLIGGQVAVPALSVMWRATGDVGTTGAWLETAIPSGQINLSWLHAQGPVAELEGQTAWSGSAVTVARSDPPVTWWSRLRGSLKRMGGCV
jgi:LmbE family N-acetylglucosaminyl deacetylase